MFWLQPPPYLRRLAIAALILFAFVWDLRSADTEPYPFSVQAMAAGEAFTEANVEWRQVPVGLLEVPELVGRSAAVALAAGQPITPAVLGSPATVPEGWWSVAIDLPVQATPGSSVLLVVVDPPLTVPGVVVTAQSGDRFSAGHHPAVVAVPGEAAPIVAAAERAGQLVAATRP